MKVTYTTMGGRLTFELETETGKTAFQLVAAIQELFEESECGCCKGKQLRCDVREYDNNKYYKLVCATCGAQLDFGQHKDGKGLFVKRWDKEKQRALPNRGWYIYTRGAQEATGNSQRQTPQNHDNGSDEPF